MNTKHRIKRIEQARRISSQFCACGTRYFRDVIRPNESLVNETCPNCGKPVKPQTVADFVKEFGDEAETEVLYPKVKI